jgi:hypothetical protein
LDYIQNGERQTKKAINQSHIRKREQPIKNLGQEIENPTNKEILMRDLLETL